MHGESCSFLLVDPAFHVTLLTFVVDMFCNDVSSLFVGFVKMLIMLLDVNDNTEEKRRTCSFIR